MDTARNNSSCGETQRGNPERGPAGPGAVCRAKLPEGLHEVLERSKTKRGGMVNLWWGLKATLTIRDIKKGGMQNEAVTKNDPTSRKKRGSLFRTGCVC